MKTKRRWVGLMLGAPVLVTLLIGARTGFADDFAAAMETAMATMDRGMMVPPSGDPDRDFATMMVPHHQGAIDMAEIELRFGHDPILLRLAQEIIVEQQQEIVVMRQTLATHPVETAPSGPAADPHAHMHMEH